MNKTLTIIVAIMLSMLLVASVFGQEVTKGLTAKGIKVGVNLAKLTGSDGSGSKMMIGFAGGGFLEYSFTPMFAIQPEVLFSMEGCKDDDEINEGVAYSPKQTLDYIQIPVLFKVKPQVKGNIKPNFFAGPFLGILMSAKLTATAAVGGASASASTDDKSSFKSTNFGIAFGTGATYKMTKGEITFDARYALGLSKIAKAEGGITPNVKTATFSLLVGYGF
jgi:hypothetical protein